MTKMWTSPKLVQRCEFLRGPRSDRGWLCCGWLEQHFSYDKSAKAFWITVSIRPSPEAISVEFNVLRDRWPFRRGRTEGSEGWQEVCKLLYNALAKHFGSRLTSGPLYLGVLYEE